MNGANAIFTMSGGTITDNDSAGSSCAGVLMTGGSTFNMYGGGISGNKTTSSSYGGGVDVVAYGSGSVPTFNMYGGKIINNSAAGAGGGVWLRSTHEFNIYGGEISSNSATNGGGIYGGNISVSSPLNVEGVTTEPIIIRGNTAASSYQNVYTTQNIKLTGSLMDGCDIYMANATQNKVFATGSAEDVAASAQYFHDENKIYPAVAIGTNLIWGTIVAEIVQNGTVTGSYTSLNDAIAAYTDPATQVIQLKENIGTASTVDKNVYLNLNGKNITGTLTVSANCTLHGLDSVTDNYKGCQLR